MNDPKVARGNDTSTKKTIAALFVFGTIIAFPLAISDKPAFAIGTNSTTSGTGRNLNDETDYNKCTCSDSTS